MRTLFSAALLGASTLLSAQGVYNQANKPGAATCPKIEVDVDSTVGSRQLSDANSGMVSWHQEGHVFYPKADRKDVSRFAAYDAKGKGTSVASLKGKIVVVELWGANCDPSARMLMDLAQLYERRAKFNFEILAVNFDANRISEDSHILGGWAAVNNFKMKNRDFFDQHQLPFFLPGLGKEGASNFMDVVYSLPLLCVIDADGKLASLDMGYEPQIVSKRLSQLIREAQGAPVPAGPKAGDGISKPENQNR